MNRFSTNFLVANLVEILQFHDSKATTTAPGVDVCKCENEIDDNPATSKCLDCEFYLCKDCTALHTRQRVTKNHKLVSIAEIQKGKVKELSQKRYCLEHEGEELKLYCRTCQKVICRDCTIVTHKQHEYTFFKDVTEELSTKLKHLSAAAAKKEKSIRGVINHIQKKKQAEQQKVAFHNQKAFQFFDNCIAEDQSRIAELQKHIRQLQQHRAALLREVTNTSSSHLKQLTVQEEEFELSCVRISSALSVSQQFLSSASNTDLAMMSGQVCRQLESLTNLPSDQSLVNKSPWTVSFSRQDPLNSQVMPSFADSIVISNLSHPACVGNNIFNVSLKDWDQEADANINVNAALSSGKVCPVRVEKASSQSWSVSFVVSPPCPDQVVVSVAVNGVEARHSPVNLRCENKTAVSSFIAGRCSTVKLRCESKNAVSIRGGMHGFQKSPQQPVSSRSYTNAGMKQREFAEKQSKYVPMPLSSVIAYRK